MQVPPRQIASSMPEYEIQTRGGDLHGRREIELENNVYYMYFMLHGSRAINTAPQNTYRKAGFFRSVTSPANASSVLKADAVLITIPMLCSRFRFSRLTTTICSAMRTIAMPKQIDVALKPV